MFLVFFLCFLSVSLSETANFETETNFLLSENQIIYDAKRVALHESSHYIIYDIVMRHYGHNPEPLEVSIIPYKTALGYFKTVWFGNDFRVQLLTYYAGEASRVVFWNEDPKTVFLESQRNKVTDFQKAAKVSEGRDIDQYEDFLTAVAWVKKYRGNISNFAAKLEKQKLIKF